MSDLFRKDSLLQDLIYLALSKKEDIENSGLFPMDFEIGELVKSPIFHEFLRIIDIDEANDKIKVVNFRDEEAGYVTLASKHLFKVDLNEDLVEALYGEIPFDSDKSSENEGK